MYFGVFRLYVLRIIMRQVSHGQTALNVSTYLLGRCQDNTDLRRPHHTTPHHTTVYCGHLVVSGTPSPSHQYYDTNHYK